MIPDPTTAVTSSIVPTNSAATRRCTGAIVMVWPAVLGVGPLGPTKRNYDNTR